MRSLKSAAIAVLVLAIIGTGAWFAWSKYAKSQEPKAPTVQVSRGDLVEVAAASGTIAPHVQVEVKSRASGEVVEVLVQEGDSVVAGQLLIKLDPADAERTVKEMRAAQRRVQAQLAEAQASLNVAKLDQRHAKKTSDLNEKGLEKGLVSSETARNATHSAKVADANIKLRQAQISGIVTQLETAQYDLEDAERRLVETEIRAPVPGTVMSIAVEKGTIVSSALTNVSGGTAVMTLADLTDLRVIGSIDEAQIGRLKAGQEVVIRVDAYPTRSFTGKVERVSPLGVETTSVVTFDVEILVTDKDQSLLRSGMSADVEILTSKHENVLLVPLTAIQSQGMARFVQVGAERRKIETGATDGTNIEVLEGLEEGDEIAATPPGAGRTGAPSAQPKSALPMGGRPGGRGR
jgi:HlyD family secretion protein